MHNCNSHAPQGTKRLKIFIYNKLLIATHTPHRGRNKIALTISTSVPYCNSHAPQGTKPTHNRQQADNQKIATHTPHRGRNDRTASTSRSAIKLQLTRPTGDETSTTNVISPWQTLQLTRPTGDKKRMIRFVFCYKKMLS